MRSLKSLLKQYVDHEGLATPQTDVTPDALAREALGKIRPDLLLFYASATKKGPDLIINMTHPAAAQEGSMIAAQLLPLVVEALGAASVSKIAFVSGKGRRGQPATD